MLQGSPEWFAARLGNVTASRVADVVAKTKTGWGASRTNYAAQLVAERLTGTVAESFQSPAMAWGSAIEDEARAAYEFATGCMVEQVAYIDHPTIHRAGASPDGYVGESGLVEIKCPNTATHIETLLGGSVPGKYLVQMQWQMACANRAWCDFISYDPRLPERMRLFVKRVERDDTRIAELEALVTEFLNEIAATVATLEKTYGQKEAA